MSGSQSCCFRCLRVPVTFWVLVHLQQWPFYTLFPLLGALPTSCPLAAQGETLMTQIVHLQPLGSQVAHCPLLAWHRQRFLPSIYHSGHGASVGVFARVPAADAALGCKSRQRLPQGLPGTRARRPAAAELGTWLRSCDDCGTGPPPGGSPSVPRGGSGWAGGWRALLAAFRHSLWAISSV